MSTEQDFRDQIEEFLARTGMSPTRFGVLAAGERNFVQRMRSGNSCTLAKYDSVSSFMSKQKSRKIQNQAAKTSPRGSQIRGGGGGVENAPTTQSTS